MANLKLPKKDKMKDLTSGKVSKNLFIFMLPAIFSNLLSRAYTTIDSIMAGKILGESALAAIGSTSGFITLITSLFWGLGTGVALYIGMKNSARQPKKTAKALKYNFTVIILVALFISGLSIVLQKPIFAIHNVEPAIYKEAKIYYIILMAGLFMSAANTTTNYIFNAFGKSSHALITSAISFCLNVGLNYLFMKVFQMGVLGAALASVISLFGVFVVNVVAIILTIKKIEKENNTCSLIDDEVEGFNINGSETQGVNNQKASRIFSKQELKTALGYVFDAWKIGLPCMLQQGVMYIAGAVVNPVVNDLGEASTAAYTVCLEIYKVCTIASYGAATALSNFSMQCYGNGKVNLINKGIVTSLLQGLALSMPVLLIMIVFPNTVASIFIKEGDALAIPYIVRYILLCCPCMILVIVNSFFHAFYRGVKVPNLAMISSAVCTVVRIVVTFASVKSLGMDGVYLGFILGWLLECIVCLIFFFTKIWKTKKYKEMEKAVK